MANNGYTKTYADGSALTEAKLDTAYQSLKLDIGNTTQLTQGGTAGQYLKCVTPGAAAEWAAAPDVRSINTLRNYGIKATAASGAIVFTLTTGAGAIPSSGDPVSLSFSSNGATQAVIQSIDVTTTKTFTLTASATLGTTSTSSTYVYLYALKNATTSAGVLLGVSRKGDYDYGANISTTAMSASADSYSVLYATAALTVQPRLLGWIDVARNSGGQWQTPITTSLAAKPARAAAQADFQARVEVSSTAPAGGVALSGSSGSFTNSLSTFVDVTNLSVTITTSGRPVSLQLTPFSSAAQSEFGILTFSDDEGEAEANIVRGTTTIGLFALSADTGAGGAPSMVHTVPSSVIRQIDFPAAGTYTYKVQLRRSSAFSGPRALISNAKLVAYEL